MKLSQYPSIIAAVAVLSATACSQGGALPSAGVQSQSPKTSNVTVRLKLPVQNTSAARKPGYVSASTKSVQLTVDATAVAFNLSNTSYCTAGTCTVTVAAPVGQDSFTLATYDGVLNSSGVPQGNLLSTATATATIAAAAANTVNLTMNPVVAAVQIVTAVPWGNGTTPAFVAGSSGSMSVAVNALDADNNIIVGPGTFIDSSGRPLSIGLQDSDNTGNTSLNTTTLTGPSSTPVTITYNGKSFAGVYPALIATAPGLQTVQTPLAVPGFYGAANIPGQAILGADGNLWGFGGQGIMSMNSASGADASYPENNWQYFNEIAQGPDGNFYVEEYSANLDRITPSGSETQITNVVGGSGNDLQFGPMAAGSDGNMWTVSPDDPCALAGHGSCAGWYVVAISPSASSGAKATYVIPNQIVNGASAPPTAFDYAAVEGPDGNFWWTQHYSGNGGSLGAIDCITPAGIMTTHALPGQNTGSIGEKRPENIVKGADGNLWFSAYIFNSSGSTTGVEVGKVTPSGTFTEYPLPSQDNAIFELSVGADGNMWFVTSTMGSIGTNGTPYLGEVNVGTGQLTVTAGLVNTGWGDDPGAQWRRGYEIGNRFYFADLGLTMVN